jgi:hypothetical protein
MKYIILAVMMMLPSAALANYKCVMDAGMGRSSTTTWVDFNNLEVAERTVENFLRASLILRKDTYAEQSTNRTRLHCFDEYGDVALSKTIRLQADCSVSMWNGNFDCNEFVRTFE